MTLDTDAPKGRCPVQGGFRVCDPVGHILPIDITDSFRAPTGGWRLQQ